MLQVRLFGQFDVRADGKRVAISSRAGQSLLAYLLLSAGTAHRRERLAGTALAGHLGRSGAPQSPAGTVARAQSHRQSGRSAQRSD